MNKMQRSRKPVPPTLSLSPVRTRVTDALYRYMNKGEAANRKARDETSGLYRLK